MSSDCTRSCERRASAPRIEAVEFPENYFEAHGAAWRVVPRRRQILPGLYRGLTIPGHLLRHWGRIRTPVARAPGAEVRVMRIYGSNATAKAAPSSAARRAAPGGFSVAETDEPKTTAPVATLRTIGGIDALLALQGEADPVERRRQAVKRGRNALDALDELKLEVLAGAPGHATLQRLKSATADLANSSGDERLDRVLSEIELRLEVEIAKLGPPR
jgi:hypothetical protein